MNTRLTMAPSSRSSTTLCAAVCATFLKHLNTCKIVAAARPQASKGVIRFHSLLALVVCATAFACVPAASAQTTNFVSAWGYNNYGQCTVPVSATSGVSAVAAGLYHTIALKGGTVLAWGWNTYGQCTIPSSATSGVSAIACGYYHSTALRSPVDTNNNARLDSCEIADNPSLDRNANGVLDSYDCAQNHALDCNNNLALDQYEMADNELLDCDHNGKIDSCDIASGVADDDTDGHVDMCEFAKGDLDLSGVVDSSDFGVLLLYFGEANPPFGDFDGSGSIDSGDLGYMALNFGEVTWP